MKLKNLDMREKAILRTLEEKVVPHHTALLIIDMQNDYAKSEGKCHQAGRPIDHFDIGIPNIQRFLQEARKAEY